MAAILSMPAVFCPAQGAAPSEESLLQAVDEGSSARVKTLLAAGANPNLRDDRGEPLLIYALHAGKPEIASVLMQAKGIDLEAENRVGQTALMVAAYQGRIDLVKALIDADAEVNHKGWTALHFAASSGQVEVVKLLLENAAYIDAESPSRTTPLMMAARIKDRPTCILLLQEGADPRGVNQAGLSASDFARRAGDPELADWLAKSAENWTRAYSSSKAGTDGRHMPLPPPLPAVPSPAPPHLEEPGAPPPS